MKKVIQVVRMEHPSDGLGFWCSHNQKLCDHHSEYKEICFKHEGKDYPTFSEDKVLNSQITWYELQDYKFAFKSITQFQHAYSPS